MEKYAVLSKKWAEKNYELRDNLFTKHKKSLDEAFKNHKHLLLGSVGGLMLLASPALPAPLALPSPNSLITIEQSNFSSLAKSIPPEVRPLSKEEEEKIANLLSKDYGLAVTSEIEGKKLNRSYGLIGGEQHLFRFPGDTLSKHAESVEDVSMYLPSGIAPGLGAWRYFSPSYENFTKEDMLREKYYIAVQTFLAPGFSENVNEYRDFFKYRKMLVVNPKTGQAVVVVIGDAGPAEWTGKHLGGSPEVMHHLGLGKGPRKGAVLYFFIDDPENSVPLGPIESIIKIKFT
ncbi:MAG: hypothetical protein ABIB98_01315 [bacterium]